jgi:hypothetical protein
MEVAAIAVLSDRRMRFGANFKHKKDNTIFLFLFHTLRLIYVVKKKEMNTKYCKLYVGVWLNKYFFTLATRHCTVELKRKFSQKSSSSSIIYSRL